MTTLLQDCLDAQLQRDPGAGALVLGGDRLSYGELERAANRLAHQLRAAGCVRGDRVGLLADKSPRTIVAMIACLKAGCAYVPLDVASPAARLASIVRRAAPAAILVGAEASRRCQELRDLGAIAPDTVLGGLDADTSGEQTFTAADVMAQDAAPPPRVGEPDDLAHLLFTSGSTGTPKGVMITHANVRAFIDWAVGHFGIAPGDRVSGHAPLHFDLSTFDVFGALSAGAELCLVGSEVVLPRQLADFVVQHALVQWFSVPSAMTYMARFGGLPEDGFPTLRRVLWCGEALPPSVLGDWMRRAPQATYTNLYGPTETTIASTYHEVAGPPADEREPIPIGRACGGEEAIVARADGQAAATGEVGEICIRGAGVSPGYWREPELTAAAFHRADGGRTYRTGDLGRVDGDGRLHFLGRRDGQIKSRGYRIELAEIELAASGQPGVAECAVVAIEAADFGGATICCAFVADPASELEAPELRRGLARRLPAYMLPSRWEQVEVLPRNANGKVDRPALVERFAGRRRRAVEA